MNIKKIALLLITGITLTTVIFSCKKKDDDNNATPPTDQPVGDTVKPVITLTDGDQTIAFSLTESYTEPGYSATDNKDGNITAKVVVTGAVDRKNAGEYTLKYNVKDTANNAANEKTRKVTVDAGIYIANTTGVRYKGTGWYAYSTNTESYYDTLYATGTNKFRFSRLANWRNATVELSVAGIAITGQDQTLTAGTPPRNLVFKVLQASIFTSGSNIFEIKGSVTTTTGTIETDEFYYIFSKN